MKTKKEFLKNATLVAKFKTYEAYVASMNDVDETNEATNQVRGFISGVEKRKGKRSEFLNRSISFPIGSCTVESLFISNKEKAAGKTPLTASKVFCSLRFTDGTNSISINDNFDEANAEFQAAGKMLLNEDGTAVEQTAGIEAGKYNIPS